MYAGIDYLTLWSRSSPEANKTFYDICSDWVASTAINSKDIKYATLYGTKGIRAEGAYIGVGPNSALLNVPGVRAQEAYCRLYNTSHTCTRMDIQVTCQHGYNPKEPAKPFYEWFDVLEAFKPPGRGKKAIPRDTGDKLSRTVYSGQSGSDIMGRIYNKYLQSNKEDQYRNCIRWEVQARREWAEMLASRFVMHQFDEITSGIPELVASFFQKRGLRVPWYLVHSKLWRSPPVQPYDYERTLKWLETSVAPSIERLTGYVSLEHILGALGIAERIDVLYNQKQIELDVSSEFTQEE